MDSPLRDFSYGVISACLATIISNPFEVVKTRMQLQQELGKGTREYRNFVDCFFKVARNEGIYSIQAGLGASMAFQVVLNGIRLGSYSYVTRTLKEKNIGVDNPFLTNVIVGSVAGAVGAGIGSPAHLVKVRLQTLNRGAGTTNVGRQYNYTGVFDGLYKIYSQNGLKGLYTGAVSSAIRAGVGSGAQLPIFAFIKNELKGRTKLSDTPLSIFSSTISSFFSTVVMHPFDIINTRLYNQNMNNKLYNGMVDCFVKIMKYEGLRGLYKGFVIHYGRLLPHSVAMLTIWEKLKQMEK